MKELTILNKRIGLQPRHQAKLKGITIDDKLSYKFYDGIYQTVPLLFVEPIGTNGTPRKYAISAARLTDIFGLPVIYILENVPAYERQRLIDHGVYFVVSSKFAYLPMLVANERIRKSAVPKQLSPVAQYILLYHLQIESLEGMAALEMANKLPYSYESITLGLTCLTDLKLCEKMSDSTNRNIIHFVAKGYELWQMAQEVLSSPVKRCIYCDELQIDGNLAICNINALAHYTWLNPDTEQMVMTSQQLLKEWTKAGKLVNANPYDGAVMVEAWKYPALVMQENGKQYVDKLSLYLSLQDNKDPRVEGELERLINEMIWKD